MNNYKIREEYMEYFLWSIPQPFYFDDPSPYINRVKLKFYRTNGIWDIGLKTFEISLDKSQMKKKEAHDAMEFLFNKAHDKIYYKNFKLYEIYGHKLIFTNWGNYKNTMGMYENRFSICTRCREKIKNTKDIVLSETVKESICRECNIIQKIIE